MPEERQEASSAQQAGNYVPTKKFDDFIGFALDASIADCPSLRKTLDLILNHGLKLVLTSISLEEFDKIKRLKPFESADAFGARLVLSRFTNNDSPESYLKYKIPRNHPNPDDCILEFLQGERRIGLVTADQAFSIKAQMDEIPCIFLKKEQPDPVYDFTNLLPSSWVPLNESFRRNGEPFIRREDENIFYRRYIFKPNQKLKCQFPNFNDAMPLELGYEIISVSASKNGEDTELAIVHSKVVDIASNEPKVQELYRDTIPANQIETQSFSDERYPALLKTFYAELCNYQRHLILNASHNKDGYYLSAEVKQKEDYLFVFHEDKALPVGEKVKLSVDDKVLHVTVSEEKQLSILFASIKELNSTNAVITTLYSQNDLTLNEVERDVIFSLPEANKILQDIVEECGVKKPLVKVEQIRNDETKPYVISKYYQPFSYIRVASLEKLEPYGSKVPITIGSRIIALRDQQNGSWQITMFKVVQLGSDLSSIALLKKNFKLDSYEDTYIEIIDTTVHDFLRDFGDKAKIQEEKRLKRIAEAKRKEEEQRRLEEEKKRAEEQKRLEEERKKAEEQKKLEEAKKKAEEQKKLEEEKKVAETLKMLEEIKKKAQDERKKLEEQKKKESNTKEKIPVSDISKKIPVTPLITLDFVKFDSNTHTLYASSKLSRTFLRLVYPDDKFTTPGGYGEKCVLQKNAHILEITLTGIKYTLREYVIVNLNPSCNAKMNREVSGEFDGKVFDSVGDKTLNQIMADYLPLI